MGKRLNLRLFEYKQQPYYLIILFFVIESIFLLLPRINEDHLDTMIDCVFNVIISQFAPLCIFVMFVGIIFSLQEDNE